MQSLKKSYSFAEAAKKANSVNEEEEDFRSDYSRYMPSLTVFLLWWLSYSVCRPYMQNIL